MHMHSTHKTHYRIPYWMLVAYLGCLQICALNLSWKLGQYDARLPKPISMTGLVANLVL